MKFILLILLAISVLLVSFPSRAVEVVEPNETVAELREKLRNEREARKRAEQAYIDLIDLYVNKCTPKK